MKGFGFRVEGRPGRDDSGLLWRERIAGRDDAGLQPRGGSCCRYSGLLSGLGGERIVLVLQVLGRLLLADEFDPGRLRAHLTGTGRGRAIFPAGGTSLVSSSPTL